jgi:hypothetical protein
VFFLPWHPLYDDHTSRSDEIWKILCLMPGAGQCNKTLIIRPAPVALAPRSENSSIWQIYSLQVYKVWQFKTQNKWSCHQVLCGRTRVGTYNPIWSLSISVDWPNFVLHNMKIIFSVSRSLQLLLNLQLQRQVRAFLKIEENMFGFKTHYIVYSWRCKFLQRWCCKSLS